MRHNRMRPKVSLEARKIVQAALVESFGFSRSELRDPVISPQEHYEISSIHKENQQYSGYFRSHESAQKALLQLRKAGLESTIHNLVKVDDSAAPEEAMYGVYTTPRTPEQAQRVRRIFEGQGSFITSRVSESLGFAGMIGDLSRLSIGNFKGLKFGPDHLEGHYFEEDDPLTGDEDEIEDEIEGSGLDQDLDDDIEDELELTEESRFSVSRDRSGYTLEHRGQTTHVESLNQVVEALTGVKLDLESARDFDPSDESIEGQEFYELFILDWDGGLSGASMFSELGIDVTSSSEIGSPIYSGPSRSASVFLKVDEGTAEDFVSRLNSKGEGGYRKWRFVPESEAHVPSMYFMNLSGQNHDSLGLLELDSLLTENAENFMQEL